MSADYTQHVRVVFQSGNKAFGYTKSDNETFVAGAGPELCVAMGKEIERLRGIMEQIAEHTDADDPDSYRCDDREGCLDSVHYLARKAIGATHA